MNDHVEDYPRKHWFKDVNILIGIGGVVATIIVGLVTYWLTADSVSREYLQRIQAARNDVLVSVSRSIGEGVVPSRSTIQSVLNSVRRQYNIKELDFETPDTVIDDILTRVLANEFLDAKRREELSEKLMAVKYATSINDKETLSPETDPERFNPDRFISLFSALTASMSSALVLLFIMERFRRLKIEKRNQDPATLPSDRRQDRQDLVVRQALVMTLSLIAVVVATFFLFTVTGGDSNVLAAFFSKMK